MTELVTKSVPQEQQEQRIETSTAVKRIGRFTIVATAVAALAVLGGVVPFRAEPSPRQGQRQVLAEIAERNRLLRLPGIRGLG